MTPREAKAIKTEVGKLEPDVIEGLRNCLRGSLLLPGDPGFSEACSIWNAMIDREPGLIGCCLGVADVVACVRFAREHGLEPSIKGGGHNISGLAVWYGGLMLDMSLMRGVWEDPGAAPPGPVPARSAPDGPRAPARVQGDLWQVFPPISIRTSSGPSPDGSSNRQPAASRIGPATSEAAVAFLDADNYE